MTATIACRPRDAADWSRTILFVTALFLPDRYTHSSCPRPQDTIPATLATRNSAQYLLFYVKNNQKYKNNLQTTKITTTLMTLTTTTTLTTTPQPMTTTTTMTTTMQTTTDFAPPSPWCIYSITVHPHCKIH